MKRCQSERITAPYLRHFVNQKQLKVNKNKMKYKLTSKSISHWSGKVLFQIEATASFGFIAKGTLGGYVEKKSNLDQGGDAWVSGNAQVYGNAWENSPLFIVGTKHSLTNCKKGYIQIGCHCKEISWWVKNYEMVGKREGYSADEIKEYGEYIKLFSIIGK